MDDVSESSNPDLTDAAGRLAALVDGIGDEQLSHPTPCEDYTVGDLLDHIMGLSFAFQHAAEKTPGEFDEDGTPLRGPSEATAELLHPEWRTKLPRRLDALAAAWRDPAAWEGETQAGDLTLPAELFGQIALDELVLHGWDLARATGQSYTCDQASAEVVFAFTTGSAEETDGQGTPGMFGPVVPVADDAPLLERALGLSGRDPSWRP